MFFVEWHTYSDCCEHHTYSYMVYPKDIFSGVRLHGQQWWTLSQTSVTVVVGHGPVYHPQRVRRVEQPRSLFQGSSCRPVTVVQAVVHWVLEGAPCSSSTIVAAVLVRVLQGKNWIVIVMARVEDGVGELDGASSSAVFQPHVLDAAVRTTNSPPGAGYYCSHHQAYRDERGRDSGSVVPRGPLLGATQRLGGCLTPLAVETWLTQAKGFQGGVCVAAARPVVEAEIPAGLSDATVDP